MWSAAAAVEGYPAEWTFAALARVEQRCELDAAASAGPEKTAQRVSHSL